MGSCTSSNLDLRSIPSSSSGSNCIESLNLPSTPSALSGATEEIHSLIDDTLGELEKPMVTVWSARLNGKLWAKYALPLWNLCIFLVELFVLFMHYFFHSDDGELLANTVFNTWCMCYLLLSVVIIPLVIQATHLEHHMIEIFDESEFKSPKDIDESEFKSSKDFDEDEDIEAGMGVRKRIFLDYGLAKCRASAIYWREKQKAPCNLTWHKFHGTRGRINSNENAGVVRQDTPSPQPLPSFIDQAFGCCGKYDVQQIKSNAKMVYTGRLPIDDLKGELCNIVKRYNEEDTSYNVMKQQCQTFAREIWFLFEEKRRVICGKECLFREKYFIYIFLRAIMPAYIILALLTGVTSRVALGCLFTNLTSVFTRFVGKIRRPHVEELAAGEYWICTFFGLLQEVKTNEQGNEYYEEQIMGQCIPKLLFYFFIFLVMMIWNFMYVSPLFFGLLVTQSISNYSLNDNFGSNCTKRVTILFGVVFAVNIIFAIGTKVDEWWISDKSSRAVIGKRQPRSVSSPSSIESGSEFSKRTPDTQVAGKTSSEI